MTDTNNKRKADEEVDEAGEESFPASDPPSYSTPQPKNDKAPGGKRKPDADDEEPKG